MAAEDSRTRVFLNGAGTAPVPIVERRWYRIAHWSTAISALAACVYFLATSRGWLTGVSGPTHSLLLLCSSTALIWSFLASRWHEILQEILLLQGVIFLVWSIVSFVQAH